MILIDDKAKCCGCHACFNICPKKSILMIEDKEGFLYPKVDENTCINCGLCERVCPIINKQQSNNNPIAYAAFSNNEKARLESSSGGVFTLLAEKIIERGGVVYGAAFDEEFNVRHYEAKTKEKLTKFRSSKYVQSQINDTFKAAKTYLDEGVLVYFSGTPCQIEGLLSFLKKEYSNLITQDIICHGVPSRGVWNKYTTRKGKIKDFSFRDKSTGWQNYSVRVNGRLIPHNEFSYMTAFIAGYSLRPSCYDCRFCKKSRRSDITLGDLWGADDIAPEMNDNKGLSLVVVNTEKGMDLFEDIEAIAKKIELEKAIAHNPSYISPTKKPAGRDCFMQEVTADNFDRLIYGKYCKVSFMTKAKRVIKRFLRKFLNKI